MSYEVQLGGGGYVGWRMLSRTAPRQKELVANDATVRRETQHFRENIGRVGAAADLVRDYRMLSFALKAHGLEDEIGNRALIRKVLESDPNDPKSLARRLNDDRYLSLAKSFGFGAGETEGETAIRQPGFADKIAASYIEAEFEFRVGEADRDMRLALHATRELPKIAAGEGSEKRKWLSIVGSPAVSEMMGVAFGLGKNLAALPIDSQINTLQSVAKRRLGVDSLEQLAQPDKLERLVGLFLARSQAEEVGNGSNRFANALALLQG